MVEWFEKNMRGDQNLAWAIAVFCSVTRNTVRLEEHGCQSV